MWVFLSNQTLILIQCIVRVSPLPLEITVMGKYDLLYKRRRYFLKKIGIHVRNGKN